MTDKERIDQLEKRLETLEKGTVSTPKKEKVHRKPSAYNNFVKTQLALEKTNSPDLSHKVHWKNATTAWGISPDNPKNKN